MAFKAINNSIRPNSIIPTLLVYSILPRITEYNTLLPTII
jgi:hypothetical protein